MYDDDDDDDDDEYTEDASRGLGNVSDIMTRWEKRVSQDEHGACWNRATKKVFEILWQRVNVAVVSGENHNTSHIKENMEYRVKSMVCRKLNQDSDLTASAVSGASSSYNGRVRRTGLPNNKTSSGGGGGLGRSHMFEYHEHEMAEMQVHTVYSFNQRDKGRNQWCQLGPNGECQYYSTHMLVTKMKTETEYPMMVFYEKVLKDDPDDISTTGAPTLELSKRLEEMRQERQFGGGGSGRSSLAETMQRMTAAGGDSAISPGTCGVDTSSAKTDLVNAVLRIDEMEAGSMSFDTQVLAEDMQWVHRLKATQESVDQATLARKEGDLILEGFAKHVEREQCCELQ
jgi:hypothetical protein